jgi:hypothetical protein
MEVRKTPLWDGDGLGGQAHVAVDLAPLADQTPAGPGGDVNGKSVNNIVEMIKNGFSEFEGNNGAESDGGNVPRQSLCACLAESQFEGCAAQQPLRFRATVLLGGHLFKIHWICRRLIQH